MQRLFIYPAAILAIASLAAGAALAHPENDPLRFEAHSHEGGRIIFTNIPKRCFRNGVLTCLELHPLLSTQGSPESDDQPPRIEQNRE